MRQMSRLAAFGNATLTVCLVAVGGLVGLLYMFASERLIALALLLPPVAIAIIVKALARNDPARPLVNRYLLYSFVMNAALLSVTIDASANTEYNPLAAVFAQLALWQTSVLLDRFSGGASSTATRRLGWACVASSFLTVAAFASIIWLGFALETKSAPGSPLLAYTLSCAALLVLLVPAILAIVVRTCSALRRAGTEARRLQWISPALFFSAAIALGIVIVSAYGVLKIGLIYSSITGVHRHVGAIAAPDWFVFACVGIGLAAQAALAYAILGRRVVDIRYYIARGATFTMLLALIVIGVGIVEFAVDKLFETLGDHIPNLQLIISVAAAIVFSMIAQRVHHVAERRVAKVLFRDRFALLEALKGFDSAVFRIDSESELLDRTASLFVRHGRCDVPVVVVRDFSDTLRVVHGAAEAALSDDDPLVVRLHASEAPVDALGANAALGSGLAFPSMLRGRLFGLVLLRRSEMAEAFAPDEQDAIAAIVVRVGSAIDSLRADRLRKAVGRTLAGQSTIEALRELLGETSGAANAL